MDSFKFKFHSDEQVFEFRFDLEGAIPKKMRLRLKTRGGGHYRFKVRQLMKHVES